MAARIGVGGIFIECNHFTSQLADRAAFERSEWLCGGELLAKDTGVLGGMIVGTVLGVFFVPLFFVVVQRVFKRKSTT